MKSRIDRSLQAAWRISAAAMLCVAASASAQSVHKEVDADGHITFTDRTEIVPAPQAAAAWGSDVENALTRYAPMNSMEAATIDANEATRRLERARQNRGNATGLRPGESTDSAVVRKLNERYLQDLKKQDREVAAAQRRSNKTSLDRSTLQRSDSRNEPHDGETAR